MKKRLITIIALVTILAITTIGASAYFNSQRDTTGHISSGTLTLKLGLSSEGPWSSSVALPWDFSGMAPGDTVSGYLWMKNVGNIAATSVTFDWGNIVDNSDVVDLADRIFLKDIHDSKDPTNGLPYFLSSDLNGDGEVSLAELATGSEDGIGWDKPFDAVTYLPEGQSFLPPDSPQWLYMAFVFDPAAGNEYQGVTLSYDLTVVAEQMAAYP